MCKLSKSYAVAVFKVNQIACSVKLWSCTLTEVCAYGHAIPLVHSVEGRHVFQYKN